MNQDAIENLFSVIRSRFVKNPSASCFRSGLQSVMSIYIVAFPSTSNCESDEDITVQVASTVAKKVKGSFNISDKNCFSRASV